MGPQVVPEDSAPLGRLGASDVTPRPIWSAVLAAVWALGALGAFMPLLFGRLCLRRITRQARGVVSGSWGELVQEVSAHLSLRRPVTVLFSRLEVVPMVWGWLRFVLLLPAGAKSWSPDRQRLVLLHELAHVKRGDCISQFLGQLASALYWFNPLA